MERKHVNVSFIFFFHLGLELGSGRFTMHATFIYSRSRQISHRNAILQNLNGRCNENFRRYTFGLC
jgi:hypothetical protein